MVGRKLKTLHFTAYKVYNHWRIAYALCECSVFSSSNWRTTFHSIYFRLTGVSVVKVVNLFSVLWEIHKCNIEITNNNFTCFWSLCSTCVSVIYYCWEHGCCTVFMPLMFLIVQYRRLKRLTFCFTLLLCADNFDFLFYEHLIVKFLQCHRHPYILPSELSAGAAVVTITWHEGSRGMLSACSHPVWVLSRYPGFHPETKRLAFGELVKSLL